ncbi:MAG TPA: nuclear transport factor 2 family protein [Arthrobacter sp.]|nr:nuclear transport factor 2 family protein [Arthrobacter sp.]
MTSSSTTSARSATEDPETPADAGLDDAMRRVHDAVMTIRSGDPQPYIDCWADDPDVTLFGAWGPIELGYPAVTSTFHWVGSRFTGHTGGGVENTVVHASGDLAYTVGFEHGPASVDGLPEQEMVIRVTHIYRRFGGEWKLVHRHADFPPADQRRP